MRLPLSIFIAILLAFTVAAGSAAAHETQSAGPFRLAIGWRDEPAFTGIGNAVEVVVSDAGGMPAVLQVEVGFGDEVVVLALSAAGEAGRFSAPLVPTEAGRYTFHVSGTIGSQAVDVTSACSEQTFECVRDGAEIQFPTRDPSAGTLAELSGRVVARADHATDSARTARSLSVVAIIVAVLALVAAAVVGWRRRPRAD